MLIFHMKKILYIALLLCSVVQAQQDEVKTVDDQWKVSLGAYIVGTYATSVSVKNPSGTYAGLSLPDLLNMKTDAYSAYLDGYYRFDDTHRIEIGWKSTKSQGHKQYTGTVFEGTPLEINFNGNVNSHVDIATAKLMYNYSFYHNDEMEVALAIGLHRSRFDLGIKDDALINQEFSFTLATPLPVVGVRAEYFINPRWNVLYSFDVFALSAGLELEDNPGITAFSGYISDTSLSTEYRFTDLLSAGVSINYNVNDISITLDDTNELRLQNNVMGLVVYGSLHF